MADLRRAHLADHASTLARVSGPDVSLAAGPFSSQVGFRAGPAARPRVEKALGTALPGACRAIATAAGDLLWLGPDEWLVVGPDGSESATCALLADAIGPEDGAVVELSAARVELLLAGPLARDVLAGCCPIDFHPRVFGPGQVVSTVLAKVPAVIQQQDERPGFRILVRPSHAGYVLDWLVDGITGARGRS